MSTVHSVVVEKLAVDGQGKFPTSSLQDIFCVLLLNLDLQKLSKHRHGIFSGLASNYQYTFIPEEAVRKMADLSLEIKNSTIISSHKYKIKLDLANELLRVFFAAKLLHCPADRTRKQPKPMVLVQPTAKGVAVLHRFLKQHGYSRSMVPGIIASPFNSMQLFAFERSAKTDRIYLLAYLVEILFVKAMGSSPTVWSAGLSHDEEMVQDLLSDFCDYNGLDFELPSKPGRAVSPFAHKFFTNPELDAHVQYYCCTTGVRMLANKRHAGGISALCFNGKSLLQWLMDCCNIFYPEEAVTVAQYMLRLDLITTVNGGDQLSSDLQQLYLVTDFGQAKLPWGRGRDPKPLLQKTRPIVDLREVQKDAALRYMFRSYLDEMQCAENFDAYHLLEVFKRDIKLLSDNRNGNFTNVCLSNAYNIYASYLARGAPYELNVSSELKDGISDLLEAPIKAEKLDENYHEGHLSSPTLTHHPIASCSSTEATAVIQVLAKVNELFQQVSRHLYEIMEKDSLEKFVSRYQ